MKLHEAIDFVLRKHGKSMYAKEIAQEINAGNLYQRNDSNPVPVSQITARINNYPDLFAFEKNGRICRIENTLKELLSIANRMQNTIFKSVPFFNISIQQKHLLLPALFFFKRMIDNPALMERHLSYRNSEINFGFTGFGHFLGDLNIGRNIFQGKLDGLMKDANALHQLISEDLLLGELASKSLSEEKISENDFGIFFKDLIFEIGKQNVKKGEFYTPAALTNLFFCLLNKKISQSTRIYNPAAGFATIPAVLSQKSETNFTFYGEEINPDVFLLAAMNLIVNGIITDHFQNTDTFQAEKPKFGFDYAFCVPPLKEEYKKPLAQKNFPVKTKDLTLLLIQKCVLSLKDSGKAFVLIRESVLFDSHRDHKELRRYLYENNLIEGIVSLPTDLLFPYSSVKTSILILSKEYNQNVTLIDAGDIHLSQKNDRNASQKNVEEICNKYHSPIIDLFGGMVEEPNEEYGRIRKFDKPYEKLDVNDFNLSVNRNFVFEDTEDKGEVKLSEVITKHQGSAAQSKGKLPFVNIKDLNDDPSRIYLDESVLKLKTEAQNGQIINESVLLVGSIAPKLKPSFFRFKETPLLVSRNIHVFKVSEDKIDLEYLISQLSTVGFQNQIDTYAFGVTSLKRIAIKDFLNLKIKLPALEEQKEIIRIQKEGIYTQKIAEAREFAQKSGITAKSEKELLGFVKHEIGNIAGGITNDIVNLQSFMRRKGIDFQEKISGSQQATSLAKVFDRMQSNMNDIENLMTNIEGIIFLADSQIQKAPVSFASFIKSECEKVDLFKEVGIKLLLRGSDFSVSLHDEKILIDKNQFGVIVRNFIINAIKHGFSDEVIEKIIVFNLDEDDDYYYINMINNGEPLPENFGLEDYLKFGGRQSSEKGSGIGGFLIGKVIENHGGTIELIYNDKALYIEEDAGFLENKQEIVLKAGVHFLIKLPKE